ncbi:hypothetical protein [Natrarchaeobaculum sulfurireducens]|uniref:hypothetical protein n=1 Tax=Natrarchaeobaculum sulfurireducens TaxID=2044521 RepID=UPI00105AB07F|nr:hypothetical protein [Natrarchaeobaculum sulfurireducens]
MAKSESVYHFVARYKTDEVNIVVTANSIEHAEKKSSEIESNIDIEDLVTLEFIEEYESFDACKNEVEGFNNK